MFANDEFKSVKHLENDFGTKLGIDIFLGNELLNGLKEKIFQQLL